MLAQFLRFLMVGGTATLIHYGVLWLLHGGLGFDAVWSTAIGFALSSVFNFIASYRFTYRSNAPVAQALWRYAVVAGTGLLINTALFAFATTQLGIHYMLAQVLATGVVLVWNFVLGRMFAFAGPAAKAV